MIYCELVWRRADPLTELLSAERTSPLEHTLILEACLGDVFILLTTSSIPCMFLSTGVILEAASCLYPLKEDPIWALLLYKLLRYKMSSRLYKLLNANSIN